MSKRTRRTWTTEDDFFLRVYHGQGNAAMARDLGRTERGVIRRKGHLKKLGAWELLGEWHERASKIDKEMIGRLEEKGYLV